MEGFFSLALGWVRLMLRIDLLARRPMGLPDHLCIYQCASTDVYAFIIAWNANISLAVRVNCALGSTVGGAV